MRDSVLRELGFEVGQRIGFQAMFGTRDESLARIAADEAVSSDAFIGRCRFEEEGAFRVRAARDRIRPAL